jgi:hypothetical protein
MWEMVEKKRQSWRSASGLVTPIGVRILATQAFILEATDKQGFDHFSVYD